MSLKNLFTINSVVLFLFGLGFLFAVQPMITLLGATMGPTGVVFARLLGSVQIAISILSWLVRNAPKTDERRAIVIFLCVDYSIATIITLIAQLSGIFNFMGWGTVVLMLLFALGFGYFGLIKPTV